MNFTTWIEENKDKIVWQPIETLPWELSTEYDPPRKYMPKGIILRYTIERETVNKFKLIGSDVAGKHTRGCSCCSTDWIDELYSRYIQYNAWAWAFEDTKRIKIQGAIEALQSLLEHCRAHTIPIDEDVVCNFLEFTKKELAKL